MICMSAVVRLSLAAIVSLLAIPSYAQPNVGSNGAAAGLGAFNAAAGNSRVLNSAIYASAAAGNVRALNQNSGAVNIRGFAASTGAAAGASSTPMFFHGADPGIPGLNAAVISGAGVMKNNAVINNTGITNSSGITNGSGATSGTTGIQAPALSVPDSNTMLPGTDMISGHNNSWVNLPEMLRRSQSNNIIPIPVNCVTAVNLPEAGTSEIYLLRPTQDISLPTEFGVLKVAKHSCALVAITSKAVTIYDIHDTKNGSVVWINGDVQRKLLPGWQLTATKDTEASFAELDPCFTIHHAGLSKVKSANGLQIVIGNFSIASAILAIRPLQKDQEVIKTAVIQNMTSPAMRSMH